MTPPLRLSFLDSILFPYNYSFVDQASQTLKILREVSACRFVGEEVKENDNNKERSYRLILIGDSGEIVHGRLTLWAGEGSDGRNEQLRFNISLEVQVPIILPGYNENEADYQVGANDSQTLPTLEQQKQVDAEGCEVFEDKFPHLVLISSEQPSALNWFDQNTGWAVAATGEQTALPSNPSFLPSYHVPQDISSRTRPNKGFEAITAWSSPRMPSSVAQAWSSEDKNSSKLEGSRFGGDSYVLTTTEGHLNDDPPGFHRWLLWNTVEGGDPIVEIGHWASRWKEIDGDPDEFLSINDMTFWPEQELLLVLERGYDGETNMIQLSTVDLTFPMSRRAHSLLNWTGDSMLLSGTPPVRLQVDNYESLCLLPQGANNGNADERLVLLVNDENYNPSQIGTQFVLLRLQLLKEVNVGNFSYTTKGTSSIVLLVTLMSLVVVLLVGAVVWLRRISVHGGLSNTLVHYQPTQTSPQRLEEEAGDEHGDGCGHPSDRDVAIA